jgi:glutaconate CoA-transferase subunit A
MAAPLDKRMSAEQAVAQLRDGMSIGIGGWSTRRKPMALVRAMIRAGLRDLTIVAYGGPDVGMLIAAGAVRKLIFGFVSLDHIPLDPYFRAARQAGTLEVLEIDEGLLHWGLRAAAMRLPFLPARTGLATDVLSQGFRTVISPYDDGEEFLAMPALKLDAALLHVHRADQAGNALILSPDPFFDELMARAAGKVFLTTEKLVATEDLNLSAQARYNPFERALVTGVIESPFGAHPTGATPDYGIDLDHVRDYAAGGDQTKWAEYRACYIDLPDHAAYINAAGGAAKLSALPAPLY